MANTIELAQKAEQLLQSELLKDVFAELKRDAYESWLRTETANVSGREDLFYFSIALGRVEQKISALADGGKIEAAKQKSGNLSQSNTEE